MEIVDKRIGEMFHFKTKPVGFIYFIFNIYYKHDKHLVVFYLSIKSYVIIMYI